MSNGEQCKLNNAGPCSQPTGPVEKQCRDCHPIRISTYTRTCVGSTIKRNFRLHSSHRDLADNHRTIAGALPMTSVAMISILTKLISQLISPMKIRLGVLWKALGGHCFKAAAYRFTNLEFATFALPAVSIGSLPTGRTPAKLLCKLFSSAF